MEKFLKPFGLEDDKDIHQEVNVNLQTKKISTVIDSIAVHNKNHFTTPMLSKMGIFQNISFPLMNENNYISQDKKQSLNTTNDSAK